MDNQPVLSTPPMRVSMPVRRAEERSRLLVIDDDPDLRISLAQLLRRHGHRVDTFANGVELVEFLASWILKAAGPPARHLLPIDAIITDVRMPGFNGLGIIQGLRAKGWTVPVVIISAYGDPALRHRIEMLDARFVEKPFEPTDFLHTLDEVLHAR